MTILVTGGAGFIGGHTVLAFIDRGDIPIVLDDLSTGDRAAVPSGVPFFAGDVGDTELVLRLVQNHRIDAILHFAAKIVVPESFLISTVRRGAFERKSGHRHLDFMPARIIGEVNARGMVKIEPAWLEAVFARHLAQRSVVDEEDLGEAAGRSV